eukprot:8119454-Pyramimonas_sp.AAC.1
MKHSIQTQHRVWRDAIRTDRSTAPIGPSWEYTRASCVQLVRHENIPTGVRQTDRLQHAVVCVETKPNAKSCIPGG